MRPPNKPPLDPPRARDTALRLLGRREHSARELKSKLRQRGVESDRAEAIVGDLGEQGWQSDQRYAEMLVRSRVNHGFGRIRIAAEMRVAGITDEVVQQAMEAADIDWDVQLRQLWERKFRQPAADTAERNRQFRFLLARGFEAGPIGRLLKHEPDE